MDDNDVKSVVAALVGTSFWVQPGKIKNDADLAVAEGMIASLCQQKHDDAESAYSAALLRLSVCERVADYLWTKRSLPQKKDTPRDTCPVCGKTAPCEWDFPVGWWYLDARRSLCTGSAEESATRVCSPECAARWLTKWQPEGLVLR